MSRILRALGGSTLLRTLLLSVLGVVFVLVLTNTVSDFRDYQLSTVGAYICAAAGLTVLTGMNGQVSLGHAAFMAIGGYTVALIEGRYDSPGVWVLPVALLAGAAVAAVAGGIIGVAAARLHGPYLAGATLALGVALPSITSRFSGTFKGDQGLTFVAAPPDSLGGGNFSLEHWQAWIGLFAAILVLFLLANLSSSGVGRHWRAVRDDEVAAELAGINVGRVRVVAFAVSAAAAGLGGGVFAVSLQAATPGSFDLTLSLGLLSAVVIGGLGTLTGAVWGSLVIVFLGVVLQDATGKLGLSASSAQRLHDNLPPAVYGLLLILFMLLLPGGIQGVLRRAGALVRRRPAPVPATAPPDRAAPLDPTAPPEPTGTPEPTSTTQGGQP